MKLPLLLSLAAVTVLIPACTTVETSEPETVSTTTETTETHAVRTPVGAATTSTTVRSY